MGARMGPARIAAAVIALVACADAGPSYGDPNGIVGRRLPNEVVGGGAAGGAFGAPYDPAANRPATTLVRAHAGSKRGPAASDQLACLDCHVAGGGAPAFTFGGRVVADGAPAGDVDVVVLEDDDKLGPVKTDADGFFWRPGPPLKEGARAYVRKGDVERQMSGALPPTTGGSCDDAQCHVPGKAGKIFP